MCISVKVVDNFFSAWEWIVGSGITKSFWVAEHKWQKLFPRTIKLHGCFVQQIRSQWDKYYIFWTKKFNVPYTCTIKTAKHLVILGLFQNASKLQNLKIAFLMSKKCVNFWNSVEIIFFLSKKQTTKFSRRQKAWKYTKSKLTLNFFKKFISSCQNFCFSVRNVKG